MHATRLLLPTSFDRAPSSRGLPVWPFGVCDRGTWPFTRPRPLRRADCVGGGRCLPVVHLSTEPLTLLAASVSARLGRRRTAARESRRHVSDDPKRLSSDGIRFWRTFGNARARRYCALRRLTASFHPRASAPVFRRDRLPRARSAATASGPSSLVRSPAVASSDPTSPSDFCNNHDPWAHPLASHRSSSVRAAVLSQSSRPVRRVVRLLAEPKPPVRPVLRRSARRSNEPRAPCGARGSRGSSQGSALVCAEAPASFASRAPWFVTDPSPREPGSARAAHMPARGPRSDDAPRRAPLFRRPRVLSTVRPTPLLRGRSCLRSVGLWQPPSRCLPLRRGMARGEPAPFFARSPLAQL